VELDDWASPCATDVFPSSKLRVDRSPAREPAPTAGHRVSAGSGVPSWIRVASGWSCSRRAWRARRDRPPGCRLRLGCPCVTSPSVGGAPGVRITMSYSCPRDMNSRPPNQITVPRRNGRMGSAI
jgi:hypothetical protein